MLTVGGTLPAGFTVIAMAALVVVPPALSVALAVRVYAPAVTLGHDKLYGAALSSPSFVVPWKNSTSVIVPVAVAGRGGDRHRRRRRESGIVCRRRQADRRRLARRVEETPRYRGVHAELGVLRHPDLHVSPDLPDQVHAPAELRHDWLSSSVFVEASRTSTVCARTPPESQSRRYRAIQCG